MLDQILGYKTCSDTHVSTCVCLTLPTSFERKQYCLVIYRYCSGWTSGYISAWKPNQPPVEAFYPVNIPGQN